MQAVGVMVLDRSRGTPDDEAAERRRSAELLKKADDLVDLAVEVRDDLKRVTTLYEEREYGTAASEPTDEP